MRRLLSFLTMALTILAVVFFALPSIQNPTLGIEFEGGYEIVYKVLEKDGAELPKNLQDVADVIASRIDIAGVKNPQVNIENAYNSNDKYIRVSVTSKNTSELTDVLTLIESDTDITFTDSEGNIVMDGSVLKEEDGAVLSYSNGSPIVLLNIADTETFGTVTGNLAGSNMMAWIGYEQASDTYIGDFAAYSGEGTPEQQALATKKLIINATVNEALTGDTAQISGNFTAKEASQIGKLLSAGSMNFELERTDLLRVDGAYGASAFSRSVIAGLVGVILIIAMMIVLYRIPGIVASLTLIFYTAAILLVFNLIGGEYGPDTIAAIVIGLGMAIDCCIILFERMNDELYRGRSVKNAYQESTKKSLSSILDANITTIIAACALYFFGKRSVKGFATMLLITTVFNVVIMLLVTRLLMFLLIKSGKLDNRKYLFGVKENQIPNIAKGETQTYFGPFAKWNFMKPVKKILIGYAAVVVIGIGFLCGSFIGGGHGLNFGLDFLEGSTASINITDLAKVMDVDEFEAIQDADGNVTVASVKYFLNNNMGYDIEPASISVVGGMNSDGYDKETGLYTLNIKIEYNRTFSQLGDFAEKVETELGFNTIQDFEEFVTITQQTSTPTMARATVINACLSLLIAFALIIIYIALRFRFTYAIASVVALIFDCLFTLAIFSIFRISVETEFVSAVLAIVGYSINNTVVIFDRVREIAKETNYGNITSEDRYQIVNKALQNCAGRSLWTTVSTLLPVLALICIGSSSTLAFSIAILSGLLSGLCSSLFIAPWFWLIFEKNHIKKLHDKAVKDAEKAPKKKPSGPEEMTIVGIND